MQHFDAIATSDYSLWKVFKKLKQPTLAFPSQMETVTGLDLIEKAIVFVNYLQNVFTPLLYGNFRTREKDIGHYKHSLFWERRIDKINKSEVLSIVKKLKKKKAPGYNLIIDQILKKLPDKGIVYLTQLFAMLRLNFIPPPTMENHFNQNDS